MHTPDQAYPVEMASDPEENVKTNSFSLVYTFLLLSQTKRYHADMVNMVLLDK